MFSFIIPACQEESQIRLTIRSINKNKWETPPEIIVVENGSTDLTASAAKEEGAIVHSLPVKSRSLARNFGANLAKNDWLIFLDSDVVLDERWSEGFLKAVKNPWYEIIQGPIIPLGKENYLNRFRYHHVSEKTGGTFCSFLTKSFLPVLNSACFAIKKKTFFAVGGFDENLPRCEDLDLGFRCFFEGLVFATESSMKSYVHWNHGILAYVKRFYDQGKSLRKLELKWQTNLVEDGRRLVSIGTIKEEYGTIKMLIHILQWFGWKKESFGSEVITQKKTNWPYRFRGRNSKLPIFWNWRLKWCPLPHTRFVFGLEDITIYYLNENLDILFWKTQGDIQNLEKKLDQIEAPGGFTIV
jgi:glycosyltransferase involved in cell wall biosynthesis